MTDHNNSFNVLWEAILKSSKQQSSASTGRRPVGLEGLHNWLNQESSALPTTSNSVLSNLVALSELGSRERTSPGMKELGTKLGLKSHLTGVALKQELATDVKKIFNDSWERRSGEVVPQPESLKLGNAGVTLQASVLYADLSGSTQLVDQYKDWFAAEIYKAYPLAKS